MSVLVNSEEEPVGDNCSTGGTKLTFGNDIDGDGTLDDNEITKSEVIMKDDKRKPIDIDIPTYHGKSSKEERKASIEAYAKGFKANSEIVREILEENLDS